MRKSRLAVQRELTDLEIQGVDLVTERLKCVAEGQEVSLLEQDGRPVVDGLFIVGKIEFSGVDGYATIL